MTPKKEELLKVILVEIERQKADQAKRGKISPKYKICKAWQTILMEKVIEMWTSGTSADDIVKVLPIATHTVQKYIRGYKYKNENKRDIVEEHAEKKLQHDIAKGLDTEARIKILSQLAADVDTDSPTRISAIKALNDLTSAVGESSRFLLEIGVDKKSMANYLAMLGIDKKEIVNLLALNDVEEIVRKMEQLNGNKLAMITTECFETKKIENREIKGDKDNEDEEELVEEDIEEISKGIDPILAYTVPHPEEEPKKAEAPEVKQEIKPEVKEEVKKPVSVVEDVFSSLFGEVE